MIPRSETLPQQSTSRAAADPSRTRVPPSSTAASNAVIHPRTIPRLMQQLRKTERDISSYSTTINRGDNFRSSTTAEPDVDQQSYKCGKHTKFATNSFAVRCYGSCQRILARFNRPSAKHTGIDVDIEARSGCGVCQNLRREGEEAMRELCYEE